MQLEVLAVDDGSRDDGADRVRAIAASDARVRCLTSAGKGIVEALTTALAGARGSYLARMDGDDVSHAQRLSRQLEAMAQDPLLGAVGVRVEGFPASLVGEGMRRYIAWQNGLVTPQDHARELFVEAPLCHPSVLLRREALEAVGGWREVPWPEDYDLWLRLDARGWRLAKVPEVLFSWRHRDGRATFQDARYALERFREAKSEYLARRLLATGRSFAIWGAAPTGKHTARALEAHGMRPSWFVDIDPRKVGRTARGVSISTRAGCNVVAPSSWLLWGRGARASSFAKRCLRVVCAKVWTTCSQLDGVRRSRIRGADGFGSSLIAQPDTTMTETGRRTVARWTASTSAGARSTHRLCRSRRERWLAPTESTTTGE